jgi:hypothetical protein
MRTILVHWNSSMVGVGGALLLTLIMKIRILQFGWEGVGMSWLLRSTLSIRNSGLFGWGLEIGCGWDGFQPALARLSRAPRLCRATSPRRSLHSIDSECGHFRTSYWCQMDSSERPINNLNGAANVEIHKPL